jgi:hypothetical protein
MLTEPIPSLSSISYPTTTTNHHKDVGMQSIGGVFLIAGAELSMGAQKWGGDGDVLSHGGQSDAWSLCG